MSEQSVRPANAVVHTPGGLGRAIGIAEYASVTPGVVFPHLEHPAVGASELGGVVVMPQTDNAWVTKPQIKDPAGNLLNLVQA